MEKNRYYSFKEPIIEYIIAAIVIIAFIVLVCITGFFWGYLFILIIPLYFLIDGFFTHKRILKYKKQAKMKEIEEETTNK